MDKTILVIGGPTASGKTDLAIEVAQQLKTEILSADSRQCYREMTIGTAKPSPEQLNTVPHHFINSHSVKEVVSAGDYGRYARRKMEQLFLDHDFLVMVGGTGMYIKAAISGMDDMPPIDESLRSTLNALPLQDLQEKLKLLDPEYARTVDFRNPRRLVRALEVSISTGRPYSSFLGKEDNVPYNVIQVAITRDRDDLYACINRRVEQMVDEGLFEEAESLAAYRNHYALKTVGYKEVFEFMDGRISKEEAISLIQQNTRRYAKRQLTWFRKEAYIWFAPEDGREIVQYVVEKSH